MYVFLNKKVANMEPNRTLSCLFLAFLATTCLLLNSRPIDARNIYGLSDIEEASLDTRLANMKRNIDPDRDGEITVEEFTKWLAGLQKELPKDVDDKDENCVLKKEWTAAIKKIGFSDEFAEKFKKFLDKQPGGKTAACDGIDINAMIKFDKDKTAAAAKSTSPTSPTTGSATKPPATGPVSPSSPAAGPASPSSPAAGPASPSSPTAGPASPSSPTAGPASPSSPAPGPTSPSSPAAGPASPSSPTGGSASPSSPAAGPASPSSPAAGPASPSSPAAGPASPSSPAAGPTSPSSPAPGSASPSSPAPGSASPASKAPATALSYPISVDNFLGIFVSELAKLCEPSPSGSSGAAYKDMYASNQDCTSLPAACANAPLACNHACLQYTYVTTLGRKDGAFGARTYMRSSGATSKGFAEKLETLFHKAGGKDTLSVEQQKKFYLEKFDSNKDKCVDEAEFLGKMTTSACSGFQFSDTFAQARFAILKNKDTAKVCPGSIDATLPGAVELTKDGFVEEYSKTLIDMCEGDKSLYKTERDCKKLQITCQFDSPTRSSPSCEKFLEDIEGRTDKVFNNPDIKFANFAKKFGLSFEDIFGDITK